MEVKKIEIPEKRRPAAEDNPFCKVKQYERRPIGKSLETAIFNRLDEIDAEIKDHKNAIEILEVEYRSLADYLKTVPVAAPQPQKMELTIDGYNYDWQPKEEKK